MRFIVEIEMRGDNMESESRGYQNPGQGSEESRKRSASLKGKFSVPDRDYYTVDQVFWGLIVLLGVWYIIVSTKGTLFQ